MKYIYTYILLAVLLFISSCGKQGCTDNTALNYDPYAKNDNGSCKYFSDAIIGNYTCYDSMTSLFIPPPGVFIKPSFQIQRKSGNITNFTNYLQPVDLVTNIVIDSSHIVINASASNGSNAYPNHVYIGPYHSVISDLFFSNDTLYYTASFYNAQMVLQEKHWGYAVK